MEKYVTSLKDLVYLAKPSCADLKAEADGGNPEACFQYGMIILLGIEISVGTPPPGMSWPLPKIDYALAKKYFGKPCLADNPEAIRMIGFIDELEGNYSSAFQHYAKAFEISSNNNTESYLTKVSIERNKLQLNLAKLELFPDIALNKTITNLLDSYFRRRLMREKIAVKIAYICKDQPTIYEAAKELWKSHQLCIASRLAKEINIPDNDPLSMSISEGFSEIKKSLLNFEEVEIAAVAQINDDSILNNQEECPLDQDEEQDVCCAYEHRCQWESKIQQKVDILVREKGQVDLEAFLEKKRLEEKKKIRIKMIIFLIVYAIVISFTLFTIKPEGDFWFILTLFGVTVAYILIAKLVFPNSLKQMQNYDSI